MLDQLVTQLNLEHRVQEFFEKFNLSTDEEDAIRAFIIFNTFKEVTSRKPVANNSTKIAKYIDVTA